MTFGVAIIGCGLIGQRRAKNLAGAKLVACADASMAKALHLARTEGCDLLADWREVRGRSDVDIVVVSTTNDALAEIAASAAEAGKHVLVEKPAARSVKELEQIEAAARTGVKVRVGFNHRYHRSIRKAQEIAASGELGELMFVRGRYGHGGRPGYGREWRADPVRSGGGELLDQGSHLIDLARMFLGDFPKVEGFATTYFWDMAVDDNAFLTLRTETDKAAFLHVSCTEWKNLFSLEIYGRDGKLDLNGLGGSYGVERITHYRMLPGMGPPETTAWEYPMADDSWAVEFATFLDDIRLDREPEAGLDAARAVLAVTDKIYSGQSLQPLNRWSPNLAA